MTRRFKPALLLSLAILSLASLAACSTPASDDQVVFESGADDEAPAEAPTACTDEEFADLFGGLEVTRIEDGSDPAWPAGLPSTSCTASGTEVGLHTVTGIYLDADAALFDSVVAALTAEGYAMTSFDSSTAELASLGSGNGGSVAVYFGDRGPGLLSVAVTVPE